MTSSSISVTAVLEEEIRGFFENELTVYGVANKYMDEYLDNKRAAKRKLDDLKNARLNGPLSQRFRPSPLEVETETQYEEWDKFFQRERQEVLSVRPLYWAVQNKSWQQLLIFVEAKIQAFRSRVCTEDPHTEKYLVLLESYREALTLRLRIIAHINDN